jgi:hypothetical protein
MLPVLLTVTGCGDTASRGRTVVLFNGRDAHEWKPCFNGPNQWQVVGAVELAAGSPEKLALHPGTGILVNGPAGGITDICTVQEFGDCEVHLEFLVAQHSNSGVYLMGEYEIQIFDSYGHQEVGYEDCGGIYAYWRDGHTYGGSAPRTNACKPPGEWQNFDIVLRAPRFEAGGKKCENARIISVKHNGTLIHENVTLEAATAGPLSKQEHARGPLRLQGDHGPVGFRNIRITPLRLP